MFWLFVVCRADWAVQSDIAGALPWPGHAADGRREVGRVVEAQPRADPHAMGQLSLGPRWHQPVCLAVFVLSTRQSFFSCIYTPFE